MNMYLYSHTSYYVLVRRLAINCGMSRPENIVNKQKQNIFKTEYDRNSAKLVI